MKKGFRTPPKTLTVELAGFPRRSLMVPPLEAGSHEQPARVMPGRCDEPARTRCHYKLLDVPIMECFDEDRKALMPLPSTRFDPIRWESGKTDRYGRIEIDSNRYLAGGKWHGGKLLAAAGWDSVRITDPSSGEMIAEYPRRYGGASSTLQDPALVMPMITARPGSWKETPIRPDFPEDVRAWLDQADKQRLHDSLKAIARATKAAGFDNAMLAASDSIDLRPETGPTDTDLVSLALRRRADTIAKSERVHRHDPHTLAERLAAFLEPCGERLLAPAFDHVQQAGRPAFLPGRQVHDDGHLPTAERGVSPHVLVHAELLDPVALGATPCGGPLRLAAYLPHAPASAHGQVPLHQGTQPQSVHAEQHPSVERA